MYKGDFKNGKMDGKGRIKYPDGQIFKGEFKSNCAVEAPPS